MWCMYRFCAQKLRSDNILHFIQDRVHLFSQQHDAVLPSSDFVRERRHLPPHGSCAHCRQIEIRLAAPLLSSMNNQYRWRLRYQCSVRTPSRLPDTQISLLQRSLRISRRRKTQAHHASCSSYPGLTDRRTALYLGGRTPRSAQVGNHSGVNPASRPQTRLPPRPQLSLET